MKFYHLMVAAEALCLFNLSSRNSSSSPIRGGIFHVPYAWPDIFPPSFVASSHLLQ
uniref:Uncharacterized protein n=1 Tax=Arundo donax TaxID=35708 RepID=A0A0A9DUG8_ARUDO